MAIELDTASGLFYLGLSIFQHLTLLLCSLGTTFLMSRWTFTIVDAFGARLRGSQGSGDDAIAFQIFATIVNLFVSVGAACASLDRQIKVKLSLWTSVCLGFVVAAALDASVVTVGVLYHVVAHLTGVKAHEESAREAATQTGEEYTASSEQKGTLSGKKVTWDGE